MTRGNLWRAALAAFLTFGVMPAADLCSYRRFRLGTDLPKVIGGSLSETKVIHSRAALIQELDWRPQRLGPSSGAEPAREVAFSFYEGELFRIVISCDRYETEWLTTADFVEAISATYGIPTRSPATAEAAADRYSDDERRRTMAGFAVPLRPDPFVVRAQLQTRWVFEEAGGPSRAALI